VRESTWERSEAHRSTSSSFHSCICSSDSGGGVGSAVMSASVAVDPPPSSAEKTCPTKDDDDARWDSPRAPAAPPLKLGPPKLPPP